jgi:uncharacterized protein YndB with AHSA1/START domain
MLKKILIGLSGGLVVLGVIVAMRPSHYVLYRERTIAAPAAKIWPWLVSAKHSNEWMPWSAEDPQMKMEFAGPAEGVGSRAIWTSPGPMGEGESEITEVRPMESVRIKITYRKPMTMSQRSEFSLQSTPSGSVVRWSVEGEHGWMGKLFSLIFNMEKHVGEKFGAGLEKLEKLVAQK